MSDTANDAPAPVGQDLPVELVIESYGRQMASLHEQIAIKDATLELLRQQGAVKDAAIAALSAEMNELRAIVEKVRPAASKRTTPKRKAKA